jgi:hypothetical protein
MADAVETVLNQIEQQQLEEEIELASHEDALEFWDKVMRSTRQPMVRRMKAAELRAQYRYPRIGVVATSSMTSEDFASMLDRAIMRSGTKLIEHRRDEGNEGNGVKPAPAPIPPHGHERQGPTIDRRFRRS